MESDQNSITQNKISLKHRIGEWLYRYEEIIHILASLVTIGSLISAILIFQLELNRQSELELNEHVSNIESLKLELVTDIAALKNIIEDKDNILDQPFHGRLVLENLKRSVSDGKIQNQELKSSIIGTYFMGVSFDEGILFLNSPEFIVASPTSEEYHRKRNILINNTVRDAEERILPSFDEALIYVGYYEECLKSKRDIKNCQNINYFGKYFEEYTKNLVEYLKSLGLEVSASINNVSVK